MPAAAVVTARNWQRVVHQRGVGAAVQHAVERGEAPPLRKRTACGQASVVGLLKSGGALVLPMRCKSWGCAVCVHRNGARLQHKVRWNTEHKRWRPNAFLTLTIDPAALEKLCLCWRCKPQEWPEHAHWQRQERPSWCTLLDYRFQQQWLRRKWTRLIDRIRRLYGETQFVRVFEWHRGNWDPRRNIRNERVHIHAIVSSTCPTGGWDLDEVLNSGRCKNPLTLADVYDETRDEYRRLARELGFGRSEATTISSSKAAGYVAKYASKQKPGSYAFRVRVAGSSRRLVHPTFEPPEGDWFAFGNTPESSERHHAAEVTGHVAQVATLERGGLVRLEGGELWSAPAGSAAADWLRAAGARADLSARAWCNATPLWFRNPRRASVEWTRRARACAAWLSNAAQRCRRQLPCGRLARRPQRSAQAKAPYYRSIPYRRGSAGKPKPLRL